MPKVVLDRTVDHLRKMATDVADWDYKSGQEWIAGYGPMPEIRGKTARLLNAQPDEIANLICYVCSKASSATNGAALRADGGIVTNPF